MRLDLQQANGHWHFSDIDRAARLLLVGGRPDIAETRNHIAFAGHAIFATWCLYQNSWRCCRRYPRALAHC